MRKNTKKWPVFHPHRFNAKSVNLETYARKLLYLLCIRMSDFVMIGPREHSQKGVTDGRTRWHHPAFLYLQWSQIKNLNCPKGLKSIIFCPMPIDVKKYMAGVKILTYPLPFENLPPNNLSTLDMNFATSHREASLLRGPSLGWGRKSL